MSIGIIISQLIGIDIFCRHIELQSILVYLLAETFIHIFFQTPVSLKRQFLQGCW